MRLSEEEVLRKRIDDNRELVFSYSFSGIGQASETGYCVKFDFSEAESFQCFVNYWKNIEEFLQVPDYGLAELQIERTKYATTYYYRPRFVRIGISPKNVRGETVVEYGSCRLD